MRTFTGSALLAFLFTVFSASAEVPPMDCQVEKPCQYANTGLGHCLYGHFDIRSEILEGSRTPSMVAMVGHEGVGAERRFEIFRIQAEIPVTDFLRGSVRKIVGSTNGGDDWIDIEADLKATTPAIYVGTLTVDEDFAFRVSCTPESRH